MEQPEDPTRRIDTDPTRVMPPGGSPPAGEAAGKLHTAARPAIIHVLSGAGELMVDGHDHALAPGSWLRMAAGTRHALVATTGLVFALYLLPARPEA